MKKTFTLLLFTAMLSTAFAQHGQQGQRNKGDDRSNDVFVSNNNRGNDHNDYGRHGGYVFTEREKNREIAKINHEYEHRIRDIKNNYFMSWFHKGRLIRNLEAQRDNDIHEVNHRFYDRRNQFGDYGQRNNRYKNNRW